MGERTREQSFRYSSSSGQGKQVEISRKMPLGQVATYLLCMYGKAGRAQGRGEEVMTNTVCEILGRARERHTHARPGQMLAGSEDEDSEWRSRGDDDVVEVRKADDRLPDDADKKGERVNVGESWGR